MATTEPISETEAKRHLRVDDDDPYVDQLPGVITAARQDVEEFLNVSIPIQERTLVLDDFPYGGIWLPYGPVISITSIAYIDDTGDPQTVANHRLTNYPFGDVMTPVWLESWPTVRPITGAVVVTYQAGMMVGDGASPEVFTLPNENIKSGIKLQLGDLWDLGSGHIIGTIHKVNPTVARLLEPYRRGMGV